MKKTINSYGLKYKYMTVVPSRMKLTLVPHVRDSASFSERRWSQGWPLHSRCDHGLSRAQVGSAATRLSRTNELASRLILRTAPLFLLGSSLLLALSAQPGLGQSENRVEFRTQIRPLLAGYCYECHGENPAMREADLRLDQQSFAFSDLGGYRAIVPGDPQESELYLRVASEFDETRMPPYAAGTELSSDEIDLIRRWIEEGAEWIDEEGGSGGP